MNLHQDKSAFQTLLVQPIRTKQNISRHIYYVSLLLEELADIQNLPTLPAFFKGGTALFKALGTILLTDTPFPTATFLPTNTTTPTIPLPPPATPALQLEKYDLISLFGAPLTKAETVFIKNKKTVLLVCSELV